MQRRDFILAGLALATVGTSGAFAARSKWDTKEGAPFDGSMVRQIARELAASPYKAPDDPLPATLKDIGYDAYRAIRFHPERALWRDQELPFHVQFFHRGFLFTQRVDLYEVDQGRAKAIPYSADMFSFDGVEAPAPDSVSGFAGFRLHYRLNRDDYFDEVAVFLGASYFRAVAKNQSFGLSARGLSINTSEPSGEEFPAFRSFWIERPAPDSQSIVVHALLDSPSAAAAYRFTIRPGAETVTDVEFALYPRTDIARPGLATLTSMFFFGPQDRAGIDDFRPAVHDSDGLAILTGKGERLWRPLSNPRDLQVSAFTDTNVRGFGLMQRPRDFAAFGDLEARYEFRPSAWVEPIGDWGEGQVILYEIPTRNEYNDNIVAFWRPKDPLQAKREYIFTYRLRWTSGEPERSGLAGFERSSQGAAGNGRRLFVLEASGEALQKIGPDAQVRAEVSSSAGRILDVVTQPNPHTKAWRLSFYLDPEKAQSIDLRAHLLSGDAVLSETWLYRWTP